MNRNIKKISEPEQKEIVDLYEQGQKISIIARTHTISRRAICNILKSKGVYRIGKFLDITGKTFGYLKVIGMTTVPEKHRNRSNMMAICQCSNCNNPRHLVHPFNLKNGKTISCGCYREQYKKITGDKNKIFSGYKEIRGTFWLKLRIGAERRGIVFNIDIKDAWELYEKQNRKCALSGLPIFFGRVKSRYKNETTASLDRIDSLKGYTLDNIQWVNKNVNGMKMTFSQEYFVNFCRLIAQNPSLSYIKDMSVNEILKIKDACNGQKITLNRKNIVKRYAKKYNVVNICDQTENTSNININGLRVGSSQNK